MLRVADVAAEPRLVLVVPDGVNAVVLEVGPVAAVAAAPDEPLGDVRQRAARGGTAAAAPRERVPRADQRREERVGPPLRDRVGEDVPAGLLAGAGLDLCAS